MRRQPLYRTMRADKLRLAALEATLEAYARGTHRTDIPTLRSIAMSFDEMKLRTEEFIERLRKGSLSKTMSLETIEGESAIGGGAAPTSRLKTLLISISHASLRPNQIEEALRRSTPPV